MALAGPFSASGVAQAQDLPQQLIFSPLPASPLDFDGPSRASLRLRVTHLPDQRRAESYTLGSWVQLGHHALRWDVSYHGVESSQLVQYGGGPASLLWSWHFSGPGAGGFALDVLGVSPTGDEALHPVAAGAPSAHARLRWSPLGNGRSRLWVGYFGRRVSPPEDRNQPLSSFPSGSGVDLIARLNATRWWSDLSVRHDLGGLPDQTWTGLQIGWHVDDRLSLESGVAATWGPRERRLMDLGWSVGIHWANPVPEVAP